MNRLLVLFFMVCAAQAAPVLSVNKAALDWDGNYSLVVGWYRGLAQSIQITNTGDGTLNWSVLADNNTLGQYLTVMSKTGTATCSGGAGTRLTCTGGVGTVTLNIIPSNFHPLRNSVGTHTTNLVFTNTDTSATVTVPVSMVVVANETTATFTTPAIQSGCTTSNAAFGSWQDSCTVSPQRPPDTSFSVPAQGGEYSDPNFGGKVRIISPNRNVHLYASLGAFNADGTYVITSDLSNVASVRTVADGTVVRTSLPGSGSWRLWSAIDPTVFYYAVNTSIYSYDTDTGTGTLLRDVSASMNGATAIVNGGQSDTSKDDWVAFYGNTGGKVCAYDIPNDDLYCGTVTTSATVNYILITKGADSVTGKRYVIYAASGVNGSQTFEVNTSTNALDHFVYGPRMLTRNEHAPPIDWDINETCTTDCLYNAHDDTVEGSDGRQYLVRFDYHDSPNVQLVSTHLIASGKSMTLPVELGGGMRLLHTLQYGSGISTMTQAHIGCAKRAPWCTISLGVLPGSVSQGSATSYLVAGVTNANPAQITTDATHSFTTGDLVNIHGVGGTTGVNGVFTATVIDGTHFTIPVDTSAAATYTAGTGDVGQGTFPTRKGFAGELIAFSVGTATPRFQRVAQHRSWPSTKERDTGDSTGTGFGYYSIPRACMSQDARMILFDSNFGELSQMRVAMAQTGIYTNRSSGGGRLSGGMKFR